MSTTFVMNGEPYAPPKRRPGKRCDAGKRRYASEREAVLAAQRFAGNNPTEKTKGMRLFRCPFCQMIHLTSDSLASTKTDDVPEYESINEACGHEIKWVIQQEWFATFVSERLRVSDDPVLESIILSERLTNAVPALSHLLTPEALSNFTPARFVPNTQDLHAVPFMASIVEESQ